MADMPERGDASRIMLAIDDLVARLTDDADGRTGYVVSAPSDEPVIHDTRKHRRATKPTPNR